MAKTSQDSEPREFPFWFSATLIILPIILWVFTIFRTESWTGRLVVLVIGAFATFLAAILGHKTIAALLANGRWEKAVPALNLSQALLAGLLAAWAAFVVIPEGATARIEIALSNLSAGQNNLSAGQEEILSRLPETPATPAIVEGLPGYWGEPGCRIVWHLALDDNRLTAEVVETLPGLPPYRLIASIIARHDDRLEVTGESPAEARGMAATFTLDNTGSVPRLSWMDRSRSAPLLLEPCPEPNE